MSAFAKLSLSLLLLTALPAVSLHAEESKAPKKPKTEKAAEKEKPAAAPEKAGATPEATPESDDEMSSALKFMLPGEPSKGLAYTHRDENDRVIMDFKAEVARKINEENVEMEKVKIIAFDEDGKQIDIDLPLSVFNIATRILDSKSQVTIKREDFEIVGETGEFNTKTRFAKLLGNVKMTILNTENLDK